MSDPSNLPKIVQEYRALQQRFRSLLLSSVDESGHPQLSYAPYVQDDAGAFYLFLSDLARHTRSLKQHPTTEVMFIEEETEAEEIFARKRLIYQCAVTLRPRDAPEAEAIFATMKETFGDLIDVLRGLSDFHLFRLEPQSGSYVRGFGQAYAIEGPELDQIRHLRSQ